jgi:hypothetical protein
MLIIGTTLAGRTGSPVRVTARVSAPTGGRGVPTECYTPGVIVAGREWRSWRQDPGQVPMATAEVGVLELRAVGGQFTASFAPADPIADSALRLHVAVLGFGMNTPVKSGENRGRELRHDFVVLSHRVFAGDDLRWSGEVPSPLFADQAERLALVAWVSSPGQLGPVQAVGGWQ